MIPACFLLSFFISGDCRTTAARASSSFFHFETFSSHANCFDYLQHNDVGEILKINLFAWTTRDKFSFLFLELFYFPSGEI